MNLISAPLLEPEFPHSRERRPQSGFTRDWLDTSAYSHAFHQQIVPLCARRPRRARHRSHRGACAGEHTASSPDGRNVVSVDTKDGTLRYAVSRDGKPIVLPSLLRFTFRNAPPLRDGLRITGESRSSFDETWTQPWGELTAIRDHHTELRVDVSEGSAPKRRFTFVVRAFDDGVGFRYELPDQPGLTDYEISEELTEFALADNAQAWWIASNRPRLDRSERGAREHARQRADAAHAADVERHVSRDPRGEPRRRTSGSSVPSLTNRRGRSMWRWTSSRRGGRTRLRCMPTALVRTGGRIRCRWRSAGAR